MDEYGGHVSPSEDVGGQSATGELSACCSGERVEETRRRLPSFEHAAAKARGGEIPLDAVAGIAASMASNVRVSEERPERADDDDAHVWPDLLATESGTSSARSASNWRRVTLTADAWASVLV